MVRLGDVCEISSSKANLTDDKIWLLNLDMVEQQTGKIISYYYVNKNELNGSITQFDTENILYSKLRPNLNKVVVPDRNGFSTSELLPLKPNSKILCREYLALYLRSDSFVSWAISKTAGAKMPRLGTKALLDKEIPLPPLDEQRRIAATLDKVTDLISKRRQQLDKLDELVKARFVEMFGDPVSNSKGLPTERGIDFFKLSNGRFVPEDKRFESGIPAYGGNGISWYTDDALLNSDTLVVGRVGFLSGNVHFAKCPLWVTDNAMYVSYYDKTKYDLLFLCDLMKHIDFRRFQDAGDLKKITQKPFMNMEYIRPTLQQQHCYVSFVEQIEGVKATIEHSLEKLETLKKALMQEYFG